MYFWIFADLERVEVEGCFRSSGDGWSLISKEVDVCAGAKSLGC